MLPASNLCAVRQNASGRVLRLRLTRGQAGVPALRAATLRSKPTTYFGSAAFSTLPVAARTTKRDTVSVAARSSHSRQAARLEQRASRIPNEACAVSGSLALVQEKSSATVSARKALAGGMKGCRRPSSSRPQ